MPYLLNGCAEFFVRFSRLSFKIMHVNAVLLQKVLSDIILGSGITPKSLEPTAKRRGGATTFDKCRKQERNGPLPVPRQTPGADQGTVHMPFDLFNDTWCNMKSDSSFARRSHHYDKLPPIFAYKLFREEREDCRGIEPYVSVRKHLLHRPLHIRSFTKKCEQSVGVGKLAKVLMGCLARIPQYLLNNCFHGFDDSNPSFPLHGVAIDVSDNVVT